jgi:hypothetical protein
VSKKNNRSSAGPVAPASESGQLEKSRYPCAGMVYMPLHGTSGLPIFHEKKQFKKKKASSELTKSQNPP